MPNERLEIGRYAIAKLIKDARCVYHAINANTLGKKNTSLISSRLLKISFNSPRPHLERMSQTP